MEGTEFDRFEMTEIDLTEEAGSMEEVGQKRKLIRWWKLVR